MICQKRQFRLLSTLTTRANDGERKAPRIPQFCMCASPTNANMPTLPHPHPPCEHPSSHPWPHRRQQRFHVQHKFGSCFRPEAGNCKRNVGTLTICCTTPCLWPCHVLSSPPRVLQSLRRIDCSHPCLQREPASRLRAEGESESS